MLIILLINYFQKSLCGLSRDSLVLEYNLSVSTIINKWIYFSSN